jgi:hypothetical protein
MRAANIFALVISALWGGMFWVGMDLLKGVAAQHVAGYPASGQFEFLVGVPFAIVGTIAATTLLANALQRFWIVSTLVSASALAALLPYLLVYGGGV